MTTLLWIVLSKVVLAQQNGDSVATQQTQVQQELQALKKDVVALNRALFVLEEDLLFPASTQVAVFVSLDIGRFFKLDSVELKLNDSEVVGFLYTDLQRRALEQGGIQKIYTGNIKMGTHQITALFTGKDNQQRDVKRAVHYSFEKTEDAVMLEIKIQDDSATHKSNFVVEEWIL
ncbi:AraC family transcriptional regulator [Catenovulum sediminis]|uniref:AraC family transcriptional regulator n=1 Tax=Catenovulum sediminis TaxID=1740262 RepID=UPI003CCC4C20